MPMTTLPAEDDPAQSKALLRDRDEHLRLILDAASAIIYEWDIRLDRVRRLHSSEPALAASGNTYDRFADIVARVHPEDRDLFRASVSEAVKSGTYLSEFRIIRPDGTIVWLNERGRVEKDAAGQPKRLLGISFDISDRRLSEQRLDEQRRLHKSLTDNATTALFIMNEHQQCVFMNPAAETLTGYSLEEVSGRPLHDVVHHTRPDGRPYPLHACPIDQAFPKNDREQGEEVFVHKDGHIYHVAFTASPLRNERGEPSGTVVEVLDISQRKRAEAEMREHQERIETLLREVNHRSKNMLAVIQAIASQTAKTNPGDFLSVFGDRVRALAASQDLLVKSNWGEIDLADLVRSQLGHFADLLDDRVVVEGPPLTIAPRATQSLGIALHELATNASKYGALSCPEGRVAISWRTEGPEGARRFKMSWVETGGPPVTQPSTCGFGTRVTTSMMEAAIGGKASTAYASAGLRWTFDCDLPSIGSLSRLQVTLRAPAAQGVLIVEDDVLLAMEMADSLREAGLNVLGPAASVSEAFKIIDDVRPSFAVLDINLGQETSEPIAKRLKGLSVPFVSVSGYAKAQRPEVFAPEGFLPKPVHMPDLVREIGSRLSRVGVGRE
jgi:PAS domain S-box-containing protein